MTEGPVDAAAGGEGVPVPSTRSRSETHGFPISASEEIELVLTYGRHDFLMVSAVVFALLWLPWVASAVTGAGAEEAMTPGRFGYVTTMVLAIAVFVGGVTLVLSNVKAIATDRGLHYEKGTDRWFIPWSEIVSIDPVVPWLSGWKVRIRDGSPVLDEIPAAGWFERLVGSGSSGPYRTVANGGPVDLGEHRLEKLRSLLDRFSHAELLTEEPRASERPTPFEPPLDDGPEPR